MEHITSRCEAQTAGAGGRSLRTDLHLMVIFRAVARRQSVTLAAQDLALSQPAVSHALGRFRDIVKDPLFVRSGNGLVLTPRAEALLSAIGPALAAIEQVIDGSQYDPCSDARIFKLGSSEYASGVILPVVRDFMRREAPHSQIHTYEVTNRAFDDLMAGRIDLLFFGDVLANPNLESEVLFTERYVVLMARNHPALGAAGGLSAEAYLSYPHARFSIGDGQKGPIDRVVEALGRRRTIGYSSTSFAAAVEVAARSDILCSMPSRLAASMLRSDLVVAPLPLDVPPYLYRLVWDARTNRDPAARWLRSRILAQFQVNPAPQF